MRQSEASRVVANNPGVAKVVFSSASKQSTVSRRTRASVDARQGRGRVGSQPGGGRVRDVARDPGRAGE